MACADLCMGQGLGGARRGGDHIMHCLLALPSIYEGLTHLLKHPLPSWWLILQENMIACFSSLEFPMCKQIVSCQLQLSSAA